MLDFRGFLAAIETYTHVLGMRIPFKYCILWAQLKTFGFDALSFRL